MNRKPFASFSILTALALLLWTCQSATVIDYPYVDPASMHCEGDAYLIHNICNRERDLFAQIRDGDYDVPIERMSQEEFRIISEKNGINFAQALYYWKLIENPKNRALHNYIQKELTYPRLRKLNIAKEKLPELIFIPGMFYDNSNIDSDGTLVRQSAEQVGLEASLIPVDPGGNPRENGKQICEYVNSRPSKRDIILASNSKGALDIVRAFNECGDSNGLKRVIAWFNIGGTIRGTPLVDEQTRGCNDYSEARFYFLYNGYDWDALEDIRSPIPFSSSDLPDRITIVNIQGIALDWQVTFRGFPYFHALQRYGPNDGLTLLRDSYVEGAYNFGAWRNDHYFATLRHPRVIQAFLYFILEKTYGS